ncbi:uncharacterized protein LOC116804895 [Drosophila mojavensis]|uniref:uncharacterized protein LOC116804895 n=1 Tax=Drosophila mojavensis TaxID=7230 RepID=UPI0013EEBE0B|nr:uncharacterized protein LOC116804895 [Drosophila mojavensis]
MACSADRPWALCVMLHHSCVDVYLVSLNLDSTAWIGAKQGTLKPLKDLLIINLWIYAIERRIASYLNRWLHICICMYRPGDVKQDLSDRATKTEGTKRKSLTCEQ